MILSWRNTQCRNFEKLIGCLFDGTIVMREDLKDLLGWSEDLIRYTIYQLNKRDPKLIRHIRTADRRNTYAFMLTKEGVVYAKDLAQCPGRIRVGEGQVYHSLGINAILMRIVREIGTDGFEWYSTREAKDIIADYIESHMNMQEKARNEKIPTVYPDALLSVGVTKVAVEYDTGSENGRQIKNKLRAYHDVMMKLPQSWRTVVFVTTSETRKRFLEGKIQEVNSSAFKAHVFVEGRETASFVRPIERRIRPSV